MKHSHFRPLYTLLLFAAVGCTGDDGDAAGELVDCDANTTAPACLRPLSVDPGTFGEGPAVKGLPGTAGVQITGGYVDGGRLIAGVQFGVDSARKGLIMAFDLNTGDRTILSGAHEDAASGSSETGAGPSFGYVRDVVQAPDGALALNSPDSNDDVELIRVNLQSGDRTLVWASRDDSYGQCESGNIMNPILPSPWSVALGSDGSMYLGAGNNPANTGVGVIKISSDGATCSVVSMTESILEENNLGSGPEFQGGFLRSLRIADGSLWALHGSTASLYRIDLSSGDRTRVSSSNSANKVGDGGALGVQWLAPDGAGGLWTAGSFAGSTNILTQVDLGSGDRSEISLGRGPAGPGKQNTGGVWPHPTKDLVLTVIDGVALVVVDPETGLSNIISL